LVSWTSLMPMSRLPWHTPVRPAPEPPADTVICTSLFADWKFFAAWSINGCNADEPAIVSLPLNGAPAAGLAAPLVGAAAAGLVGLVEVVLAEVHALSNAPTTRHSNANHRNFQDMRVSFSPSFRGTHSVRKWRTRNRDAAGQPWNQAELLTERRGPD